MDPDPDDAQAVLLAASAAGQVAVGRRAGHRVRRWQVLPSRDADADDAPHRRGVTARGYSLHAATWVSADDRPALERLARYLLRPPLAKARLEERPDGNIVLHLRRPWRDGTAAFLYSAVELTEKLAALVVRPRVHTVHYHGVFAAHSAWRAEVVVDPAEVARRREAGAAKRTEQTLARRKRRSRDPRRGFGCPWSELLERVFGTSGFTCPRCGSQMRLRAIVVGPPATTRILAGLAHSSRAPPAPAQAP